MRSSQSKKDFLSALDWKDVKELSSDCDIIDYLSEENIKKLDKEASEDCQYHKRQLKNNALILIESSKMLEADEEKSVYGILKACDQATEVFKELAKIPHLIRESSNPKTLVAGAVAKVKNAVKKGYMPVETGDKMIENIEGAFDFDPLWTTSYQSILGSVQKGKSFF